MPDRLWMSLRSCFGYRYSSGYRCSVGLVPCTLVLALGCPACPGRTLVACLGPSHMPANDEEMTAVLVTGCAMPCRPTHERIRRVKDWIEVEEALARLTAGVPLASSV